MAFSLGSEYSKEADLSQRLFLIEDRIRGARTRALIDFKALDELVGMIKEDSLNDERDEA